MATEVGERHKKNPVVRQAPSEWKIANCCPNNLCAALERTIVTTMVMQAGIYEAGNHQSI
jgi:hypothetical protein